MGSYVGEELHLAMAALENLDEETARQVYSLDRSVNEIRFAIEEKCFTLLATQQPAASDLRLVFSAANMIVDLERMGDQTKGI
jgi:phosphate transport system protein